jgi:hypothetical protein
MNNETKEKLIDAFIDFVVKSSESELNNLLGYLQTDGITKTLTGAVLAVFISGYTFCLGMNKELFHQELSNDTRNE